MVRFPFHHEQILALVLFFSLAKAERCSTPPAPSFLSTGCTRGTVCRMNTRGTYYQPGMTTLDWLEVEKRVQSTLAGGSVAATGCCTSGSVAELVFCVRRGRAVVAPSSSSSSTLAPRVVATPSPAPVQQAAWTGPASARCAAAFAPASHRDTGCGVTRGSSFVCPGIPAAGFPSGDGWIAVLERVSATASGTAGQACCVAGSRFWCDPGFVAPPDPTLSGPVFRDLMLRLHNDLRRQYGVKV